MNDFLRLGIVQKVDYTAASALSSAFGPQTYGVRVVATTDCHVKIGDGAVTATTSETYLPAEFPEYFTVTPGQKIAVVRSAVDGSLFVTELV
jgi:hypothetical protein